MNSLTIGNQIVHQNVQYCTPIFRLAKLDQPESCIIGKPMESTYLAIYLKNFILSL